MRNYIFLLLAIALIGIGMFWLGDSPQTNVGNMAKMLPGGGADMMRGKSATPAPTTETLLSLSGLANVTGILSFVIQIAIWAKSGLRKG